MTKYVVTVAISIEADDEHQAEQTLESALDDMACIDSADVLEVREVEES